MYECNPVNKSSCYKKFYLLIGGLSSIEREKIFVESQLKMCEHRHATSKLEWETFKHQMEQSVKLLDAEKSSLQEQLQVSQNTVTRLQEAKTDSEQKVSSLYPPTYCTSILSLLIL